MLHKLAVHHIRNVFMYHRLVGVSMRLYSATQVKKYSK